MKKKILFFLISCIVTVLIGCDDKYLTTEPTDRISSDNFWKKEEDGILAVNASYTGLDVFRLFSFEGCSDNAITAKTWTDCYQVANGSFTSSWPWVTEAWRDAYTGIGRANNVVQNIDRITDMDPVLQKRLKAEARVMRAFLYNILINLYGDVPLITEPVEIIDDAKKVRESKEKVFDFIVKELDLAIPDLPPGYGQSDIGRITKGAAYALKARACLWQGHFKEARDAAKAVIDLGTYQLLPDYSKLFTYSTENNIEVILDDQYMPINRTHNSFQQLGPRSSEGLSNYVPTRSLVDAYEPLDPRRNATILFPGDINPYEDGNQIFDPSPGSKTPDEANVSYDATCTGYQFKKYVLKEDRAYNTRCNINLVEIRYADVLLMFAEAENEVNATPSPAAYNAVNDVRYRARPADHKDDGTILPDLKNLSKEDFREAVRRERRVELAGEGLRYFDLLRWRTAENALNATVYGMDYKEPGTGEMKTIRLETRKFNPSRNYLWPVPEQELRLNPNLGQQNPGY